MKLIADYHTHTRYSHGEGSVEDNVAAAKARGLKVIGISDHGPANLFGMGVKSPSILMQIKADVFVAQRRNPGIRVLMGAEANVISTDGQIDLPQEIIEHLDYLLVGLHPLVKPATPADAWHLTLSNWIGKISKGWDYQNRIKNTQALISAVERYPVLAITHPGYRLNIDTRALALACASRGTALEINCSHDHITSEYINIAKSAGARFIIGSDAHRPEDVGRLDKGLQLAIQSGLALEDIFNAEPDVEEPRPSRTGGIYRHIAEVRRQKRRHRLR